MDKKIYTHMCTHCNHSFSTEANLKTHVATAKYCLKLQGADIPIVARCEFCHKTFTQKQPFDKHIKTCESKLQTNYMTEIEAFYEKIEKKSKELDAEKLKVEKLELTSKNSTLLVEDQRKIIITLKSKLSKSEKRNNQQEKLNQNLNDDILKLKEELAYEKGQSDALKSKSTTTIVNKNCNMSSKLSNIQITTIKPFTIEHIAELVPNYTRSHFLRKHQGIVDIIVPFTTLEVDGVMERNIVCTDMSRTICHLLAEDRSWSSDNGLSICSKVVGLFIPKMIEYMKVINDTFNEARKIMDLESDKFTKSKRHADAKKIFDEYFLILEDMNPFYRAAYNKREEYDNLLRVFRDLLKPAIHIRSNRVTEV